VRKSSSLAMLVAAGALGVSVPAGAALAHQPAHPAKSHKCTPHRVAYITSGAFVSWAATQTSNGRYTGTITVHVKKANHHAAGAKGNDVTYTLDNTRVLFGKNANPPVAGDRVELIGKITEVAKKCTDQSGAGVITVRKVGIRTPKGKK
jgi:hypothetical protein